MHEVYRSAIVPYSADAMFDLVADVESYAEFLPWCADAEVMSGSPKAGQADSGCGDQVVARLELSQGPLTGHFTTRNQMDRPHGIAMTLVEGSFSELEGLWEIEALGDDGCKLSLTMRFAFSNPVKDMLLGSVFERSCNTLVDAFVERARSVYG